MVFRFNNDRQFNNEYCKQLDDDLETDKEVENVCKKYR